ncbi:MAG: SIS domain-containing protein [Nitrospinota bacterium]
MADTARPGPEFWRRALSRRETLFKALIESDLGRQLDRLAGAVANAMAGGGKVLLFGNGGSAAAAQHAAAEWVGRFLTKRNPLPAIALTADTSILTAVGNDYGFDRVFERQVQAIGRPGDVVIGLSTSGESENVIRALRAARRRGAHAAAFLGGDGGRARRIADSALIVPASQVALIQEIHGFLLHVLCEEVERRLQGRRLRKGTGGSSGRKK